MSAEFILSLIIGLFGVITTIFATGGTMLFIALRASRAVESRSDVKIEAVRTELLARIEAVRMETKTDRHNYVDKIDNVLNEIRNDFLELSNTVAEGFGRLEGLAKEK